MADLDTIINGNSDNLVSRLFKPYPSVALGLAGTNDQDYFLVTIGKGEALHLNDEGVATFLAWRSPLAFETYADLEADSDLTYDYVSVGDQIPVAGHHVAVTANTDPSPHFSSNGSVNFRESGYHFSTLARFQNAVSSGEAYGAGDVVYADGAFYQFLDDGNTEISGLTGWEILSVSSPEIQAALDASDLAVAAVTAAGNYYVDTTLAGAVTAAEAALIVGDFYAATGADVDYVSFYEIEAGPVSTELFQLGTNAKIDGKSDIGHGHAISDITNLQTTIDTKAAISNIKQGTVIAATVAAESTSSNIVLTGTYVPSLPSAGACVSFVADRNFVPLDDSGSPYDGQITAQWKDSNGNLSGRYNISPISNGATGENFIQNRGTYRLVWLGGPSNVFRLSGYGDIGYGKATTSILRVSAVAGTADAIQLTTDYGRVDTSMLTFKAAFTNTSVNVTVSVNGVTPTNLRHANGNPLRVGDIVAGRWYLIRYDASGGNPWVLISSGVTVRDVEVVAEDLIALDTRVSSLEAASGSSAVFSDEAIALMDKINGPRIDSASWDTSLRNPDHTTSASTGTTRISWDQGVRTEESPAIIKTLGFGSSIDDTGAGSGDSATYTPSIMFVDKLRKRFAFYRNIDFQQDNVAVGGQTIGQMLAQIQGATPGDYDIIVGGNPMNSGGIADTAGGATMRSFRAALENVVDEIRNVRNAVPILTPTFHPHIFYDTSGGTNPQQLIDNYRVAWPRGNTTYQVNGNHEFDGAGGRIKLINIKLYGNTLADGDTIYVPSGSAAGTYTIATGGIDWDTSWVTLNEAVPFTGTYSVQVTNRAADEERVVWPPLSERIQTIDRTGRGIVELPGWITYDETNRIYQEVGHIKDCMIADLEYAQFRFLEDQWVAANGVITDSDLYDTMYVQGAVRQANHPNAAFYAYAYGGTFAALANHIHNRTLHQHRVLRLT